MIELLIASIFIMLTVGFVALGELLNNKYQWINTMDSDYQDHLERNEHDKYYVRKHGLEGNGE